MAELLVKAVDATHPDPTTDARYCYKQGDVVGVAPDGWHWGALELLPPAQGGRFVIIKITDVTRQQVINWVSNHWQCDIQGLDINARRRRVRIDIDLIPASVKQTLNQTGQYSTTWAAIRAYVRNKQTQATAANQPIS